MLGLLLADVTAGTRAEVCILECPLIDDVKVKQLSLCDSVITLSLICLFV